MKPVLRRTFALLTLSFALPLVAVSTAAAETVDASNSQSTSSADTSGAVYARLAKDCAYSTRVVATMDDAPTKALGYNTASKTLTGSSPQSSGYQCDGTASATQSATGSSGVVTAAAVKLGTKTFLPSSPSFSFRSNDADFDAQTNMNSSKFPTAFGYQINNGLTSIATGPTEIASVVRTPANCTYNKPGVPVVYLFHWSCTNQVTGKGYALTGHWRFPVKFGTKPGHIDMYWNFNYIIYTRIT